MISFNIPHKKNDVLKHVFYDMLLFYRKKLLPLHQNCRSMRKEFGKWFMDVAKYMATAVLISSFLGGFEQK